MEKNKITQESVINSVMAKHDQMNGSDFPLHLFPVKFQEVARGTVEGLGFPLDFIAGSMFFAAAVAIGATHGVQVRVGWVEYPLLYLSLVGSAGTNKSHPMSFAMKPIFKFDGEHYKTFRQHYKEYQQLMTLSKKEREEQGITEPLEPPLQKRYIVSDITPEGLTFIHEQNPRGLCLYADELKAWINNFNRYSKGSEEEFWLSNFSGMPITIDRRNVDNSTRSERSLVSVIGTIQPMQLKDLAKGDKCHIIFNRMDNFGRRITDSNDQYRSEKICKELTRKHGLYFAEGKERVKRHRLNGKDATKYKIHDSLVKNIPLSKSWLELKRNLRKDGIEIDFKTKGTTSLIEGVRFTADNTSFNGSKVDRQFSYSKIDFALRQNAQQEIQQSQLSPPPSWQIEQSTQHQQSENLMGGALGLLDFTDNNPAIDTDEEAFQRSMQKKKKKPQRKIKF